MVNNHQFKIHYCPAVMKNVVFELYEKKSKCLCAECEKEKCPLQPTPPPEKEESE